MKNSHLKKLVLPASILALSGCQKPLWLSDILNEEHESLYITDVNLDYQNNTYSTGSLQTYLNTDDNGKEIKGFDILTVKHDSDGNELWRATYSSPYERTAARNFEENEDGLIDTFNPDNLEYSGGEEGQYLLNDVEGNTYVIGRMHGVDFDASTPIQDQDWDVVILKYNANGELVADLILEDINQFDATRKAFIKNNELNLAINNLGNSEVLALNLDLDIEQQHTLNDTRVLDLEKTLDGKWITAEGSSTDGFRSVAISQYDQNMVQEWTHIDSNRYNRSILPSLALDSRNNVIASSTFIFYCDGCESYPPTLAKLEKFSPNGELAWDMYSYGGTDENFDWSKPGKIDYYNLNTKIAIASDDSIYLASQHFTIYTPGELNDKPLTGHASTYVQKISAEGEAIWKHSLEGSRITAADGESENTIDRRLNDISLLPNDSLAVGYEKVFGTHTHYDNHVPLFYGGVYSRDWYYGYDAGYLYKETDRYSNIIVLNSEGETQKTLPSLKGKQQRAIATNANNRIVVSGDNNDFQENLPLTWDTERFFQGLFTLTPFEAAKLRKDSPSKGFVAMYKAD